MKNKSENKTEKKVKDPNCNIKMLFVDGPRRIKGLFWWHWLDATNDNSEEEWKWTVKGIEIPLSETPTYWDFEEPSNSSSYSF